MPKEPRQGVHAHASDFPSYLGGPRARQKLADKHNSTIWPSQGYLLKVQLREIESPEIYRIIRVPANTTFHRLHKILQVAFEWEDEHLYEFQLFDADSDHYMPKEYLVEHPVEMDTGLAAAMGQEEPVYRSSTNRKLSQVFGHKHKEWTDSDAKIIYEYDMGDGWEHEITLVGTDDNPIVEAAGAIEEGREVLCLAGSGHPCEENCGGPYGWERRRERLVARGDFDPEEWDMDAVNESLLQFRYMAKKARRDERKEQELQRSIARDRELFRLER